MSNQTRGNTPSLELRPLKSALSAAGGQMPFLLRITPERSDDQAEQPRINLSLVLDRSGSMGGEPLEHAKLGAHQAVEMLGADDRVSVVTYDDQVDVIVASTPAADKPRILEALRGVHSGGTTALHAGWLEGAAQASQNLDPSALNRVVLLTDGLANQGETDPDIICGDVAGLKQHGVTTSALGLGRQFNEDLLEGMANAGGGNYYHAETANALRNVFAAELRGLSATVGRGPRVTFRANGSGAIVAEVLNDLPEEEGALLLPDLIAGLPLEVAGILESPALPAGEAELGTIELSWRSPAGEPFVLSLPIRLDVVPPAEFAELPEDPEVASLIAEMQASRIKREATEALDRGDRDAAGKLLGQARQMLYSAPQTDRVVAELGDMDMLESAMSMKDDLLARKRMKSQAYRKSRSFYHERLEPDANMDDENRPGPTGAPVEAVKIPRADGSIGVLELTIGDITTEGVDAILNPTNPGLFGTGRSVDGAVHRKGGSELTRACREIGRVEIGRAVVTPGFRLPAQYVIHTAVPKWGRGPKDGQLLASCYRSALDLANRMSLQTLAVPAVGAGTNGFPVQLAAEVALTELRAHLLRQGAPERVRVVLFDRPTLQAYESALEALGHPV